MVEFALTIPLLLVILVGMAEFGRIFAIYTNLFNAAREGARYGIVYPTDVAGILSAAQSRVSLVPPAEVTFTINYDSGPGTSLKSSDSLIDGDRVIVNAYHDLQPMLPLLRPILQGLYIDTTSARTIARFGGLPPAQAGTPVPGVIGVSVGKTASPATLPETGDDVTFTFSVNNTGVEDLTLTALSDSFFGDLNGQGTCAVGGVLSPGTSYTCSTSAWLESPSLVDHVNTVTATLEDAYGRILTESATATVLFTDVDFLITLSKTPDPTSVPETGGNVEFTFAVFNTSTTEPVTLTVLSDSTLGNLAGKGSCVVPVQIAAGGSYACAVTSWIEGIGSPQHDNRAVATAEDNEGNTDSAEATATVLFTQNADPIAIAEPLLEGGTIVTGTAHAGETVILTDLQDDSWSLSAVVGDDGVFTFDVSSVLPTGLVADHVMVVRGYGRLDYATVEVVATPTPAPTPTPEPMDIRLEPVCGPAGDIELIVWGYDWPKTDVRIDHTFGTTTTTLIEVRYYEHDTLWAIGALTITDALTGSHTIQSYSGNMIAGKWEAQDSEVLLVPCPPENVYPNLVVQSVTVSQTQPISTGQLITFAVTLANVGTGDSSHVFWTDLYLDPTAPISPTSLSLPTGDHDVAVGALDVGAARTFLLARPEGLSVSGTHTVSVIADTWHRIEETSELDNLSAPLTLSVVGPTTPPTPTPTPLPVGRGAISGSTWLYYGGALAPQGRVRISIYTQGGELVAQGYSDRAGQYLFEEIQTGTFNVFGELRIDDELYLDIQTEVTVEPNEVTPYVDLVLY
ncbi:MAG: pilus assembly protein [Anaerolineae bacterium]|nr:pilus assembly protein [Anaerolineae bacterium]